MKLSETATNIGSTYSLPHYLEYARTRNKNLFEEIIDRLILDGVAGMNESFRNSISSLSPSKKRMAILSLLDKDRNLFTRIKALIDDRLISNMDHIKDVITMLREYVKVGEVEKKKFGEVMTPLELVKEMLATLPVEVWSNPNLKWLDPANGTGPYPTMVIYRLMNGLKDWEPNEELRYKHIIENMIYVAELQPKNMFLYMCVVDPLDKYDLNIYTGSFLEPGFDRHMKAVWEVDKFDIVMGNPPYNAGTSGGNGSRDIWDKFVVKSINILIERGYLLFVHPSKWRRPESSLFEIFKSNNLIYLEIHNKQDGQKLFGAITRYDWYLLQKSKYNGRTMVKDEVGCENIIDLNDWNWLPNYSFNLIKGILSNINNCNIIYSRSLYGNDKKWMSKNNDGNFTKPCVYGMYKNYTCSYYYSSQNKGHFGISKVILGCGEKLYPNIDFKGEYGIMQNAFAISVDTIEEANNIKMAIESSKFKEIIKSTKWLNFQTDYKMFKSFRKDFWKEFI